MVDWMHEQAKAGLGKSAAQPKVRTNRAVRPNRDRSDDLHLELPQVPGTSIGR